MAEVNVEKKRPEERDRQEPQTLERRQDQGLARRNEFLPSSFWRSPSELFTTNPFTLMRRFTEEMDRAFSGDCPDSERMRCPLGRPLSRSPGATAKWSFTRIYLA